MTERELPQLPQASAFLSGPSQQNEESPHGTAQRISLFSFPKLSGQRRATIIQRLPFKYLAVDQRCTPVGTHTSHAHTHTRCSSNCKSNRDNNNCQILSPTFLQQTEDYAPWRRFHLQDPVSSYPEPQLLQSSPATFLLLSSILRMLLSVTMKNKTARLH